MKSVLKRRKHRKGIRPVRKGTLKVRMVTLPTYDEHSKKIDELMGVISKAIRDPKFNLYREMTYNEMWAHQRHRAMMDGVLSQVTSMQRGYDFFREFRQINITDLATPAVSEFDPIYSKVTTACDTCSRKFLGVCPFIACQMTDLCHKLQDSQPQVKTTAEMAEMALTHLS